MTIKSKIKSWFNGGWEELDLLTTSDWVLKMAGRYTNNFWRKYQRRPRNFVTYIVGKKYLYKLYFSPIGRDKCKWVFFRKIKYNFKGGRKRIFNIHIFKGIFAI